MQRQQQEQTALLQSRKASLLSQLVSVVYTSPIVPGTLVTRGRADALLWESRHRQEKLRPKIPRFAFPTKAAASDLPTLGFPTLQLPSVHAIRLC